MTIMVRRGQTIEITDDNQFLTGTAARDWDDEGEQLLAVQDDEDGAIVTVRTDLATSFIVDGIEIVHLL